MTYRKDTRINIALKLYPDKDGDLIDWLEGLERGDRLQRGSGVQGAIKAVLRAALFGAPLPDDRDETIRFQREQLDQQRDELDDLRSMRQEIEQLRRTMLEGFGNHDQWIAYLNSAVEGRANVTPVSTTPQTQPEEVQTIDSETERRREERLKKVRW